MLNDERIAALEKRVAELEKERPGQPEPTTLKIYGEGFANLRDGLNRLTKNDTFAKA